MKIRHYLPTAAETMFGVFVLELFLCIIYGIPEFDSFPVSLYLCTALALGSWLALKREAAVKSEMDRIMSRERA